MKPFKQSSDAAEGTSTPMSLSADYNVEFKSETNVANYYAPDAYRSSDHDPLVVALNLVPESTTGGSTNGEPTDGTGNEDNIMAAVACHWPAGVLRVVRRNAFVPQKKIKTTPFKRE